jgi:hypothetical protein
MARLPEAEAVEAGPPPTTQPRLGSEGTNSAVVHQHPSLVVAVVEEASDLDTRQAEEAEEGSFPVEGQAERTELWTDLAADRVEKVGFASDHCDWRLEPKEHLWPGHSVSTGLANGSGSGSETPKWSGCMSGGAYAAGLGCDRGTLSDRGCCCGCHGGA